MKQCLPGPEVEVQLLGLAGGPGAPPSLQTWTPRGAALAPCAMDSRHHLVTHDALAARTAPPGCRPERCQHRRPRDRRLGVTAAGAGGRGERGSLCRKSFFRWAWVSIRTGCRGRNGRLRGGGREARAAGSERSRWGSRGNRGHQGARPPGPRDTPYSATLPGLAQWSPGMLPRPSPRCRSPNREKPRESEDLARGVPGPRPAPLPRVRPALPLPRAQIKLRLGGGGRELTLGPVARGPEHVAREGARKVVAATGSGGTFMQRGALGPRVRALSHALQPIRGRGDKAIPGLLGCVSVTPPPPSV